MTLAALLEELTELNAALMKNESSLRTVAAKYRKRAQKAELRIKELEVQVEDLKEIAVSEGANNLFNGPWDGGLPVEASYDATMEKAKEDARRQLEEKHPEAFR